MTARKKGERAWHSRRSACSFTSIPSNASPLRGVPAQSSFSARFQRGHDPLEMPNDSAVALAYGLFQASAIHYCNPSSLISDQALALQRPCDTNNGRPMYAKHLANGLLGERKRSRANTVLSH